MRCAMCSWDSGSFATSFAMFGQGRGIAPTSACCFSGRTRTWPNMPSCATASSRAAVVRLTRAVLGAALEELIPFAGGGVASVIGVLHCPHESDSGDDESRYRDDNGRADRGGNAIVDVSVNLVLCLIEHLSSFLWMTGPGK